MVRAADPAARGPCPLKWNRARPRAYHGSGESHGSRYNPAQSAHSTLLAYGQQRHRDIEHAASVVWATTVSAYCRQRF
jgi:hypothetical protein